jgi:hypothetical protein
MKRFFDYQNDAECWITLAEAEFYPDILSDACALYLPILQHFSQLLKCASSSIELFEKINENNNTWQRIQLCRIFKKYVSPQTPVEMLKKKSEGKKIINQFSYSFRKIAEVQKNFSNRPMPDEALCALLWEYKDRGKKGYDLTEKFFQFIRNKHPKLEIIGPERAGKDIQLSSIFPSYPKANRPVDFIILKNNLPLIIGLARYDSDRGGAQEDDRIGQYREVAQEIIQFSQNHFGYPIRILFLNDGPGLLLGSMWRDYSALENLNSDCIMVATLRMLEERFSAWVE